MPTFLAPNGIAPLERHFTVAVAAQVVDGGAFGGEPAAEGVARRCWGGNRGLVSFAGHSCDFVCRFVEKGEREVEVGGMKRLKFKLVLH